MLIAEADVAMELPADDRWASMEELLGFEPGPAMVSYLSCLDVTDLDERAASVALSLVERQQAWLSELAVTMTARVAGPTPPPDPDSEGPLARDSFDRGVYLVGATLGMTTGGAEGKVHVARAITESLPKCRLAMAAGAMNYLQAWLVAEAVAPLDDAAKAVVDARVASRIAGQSWPAFRRTLRRAVLAAAPDVVLAENAARMAHRDVEKFDFEGDVMSQLQVTMSSIDAQTVWLGLDATALQLQAADTAAGQPDAGIGAYRSDALVAWANHVLADPNAPRRHGRRHQVQYVIDLPSLLG